MGIAITILNYGLWAWIVVVALVTMKVFRGIPIRAIVATTIIACRGAKLFIVLPSILFLTQSMFPDLLSHWIPPFPRAIESAIALFALCTTCLPPAFLFLAASNEPSLALLHTFQRSVSPLRVVHLLNISTPERLLEAGANSAYANRGKELNYDRFRVRRTWQTAVRRFSHIAPAIIVDARIITPAVAEELHHLVGQKLCERTFLVVSQLDSPFADTPAFRDLGRAPFHFVSVAAFQRALPLLGWCWLASSSSGLVAFLARQIERRLSRTSEEMADEFAHEATLRELGTSDAVLKDLMHEYRWRRDEGTAPPPSF